MHKAMTYEVTYQTPRGDWIWDRFVAATYEDAFLLGILERNQRCARDELPHGTHIFNVTRINGRQG